MSKEPSERLAKCLQAGSIDALFPLLADWPPEELKALLEDIEQFYGRVTEVIQGEYDKAVFKPEVFFNPSVSKMLDAQRDQAVFDLIATCAEISSVAYFYLPDVE